jgi:quercetin dioxygenase-like cupin family protein
MRGFATFRVLGTSFAVAHLIDDRIVVGPEPGRRFFVIMKDETDLEERADRMEARGFAIDYAGPNPSLDAMNPVVASDKLKRTEVWAEDDESVHWAGAVAVYGGHGATASSTIVYEIEPGHRLGWHTDATEEAQYIIAGNGELHMEDGNTYQVGPGSIFAIPTPVRHDLVNVGKETLRAVAFFAAAMFTQTFDNVMMPPKSHILGTPNREG